MTTIGNMVVYTCESGYVLVGGSQQRTCQDNGTWDGTEPTCSRKCIDQERIYSLAYEE